MTQSVVIGCLLTAHSGNQRPVHFSSGSSLVLDTESVICTVLPGSDYTTCQTTQCFPTNHWFPSLMMCMMSSRTSHCLPETSIWDKTRIVFVSRCPLLFTNHHKQWIVPNLRWYCVVWTWHNDAVSFTIFIWDLLHSQATILHTALKVMSKKIIIGAL